jgi:hypothetical protein
MEETETQFALVLDAVVNPVSHTERERVDSPEGEENARAEVLLRATILLRKKKTPSSFMPPATSEGRGGICHAGEGEERWAEVDKSAVISEPDGVGDRGM